MQPRATKNSRRCLSLRTPIEGNRILKAFFSPTFLHGLGLYPSLRDPAFFAKAFLQFGALTWPGDLDLAPNAMHDAISSTGRFVA